MPKARIPDDCVGNGYGYDENDQAIVEFDYPNGKVWVLSDVMGYDMYEGRLPV